MHRQISAHALVVNTQTVTDIANQHGSARAVSLGTAERGTAPERTEMEAKSPSASSRRNRNGLVSAAGPEIPRIARSALRELDGEPRVSVRQNEIRSLACENDAAGMVD